MTLALRSVQDVDPQGPAKEANHLIKGGSAGSSVTVIKSGQTSTVVTK
jgi:Flp pilus assembly protein CpaB